MPLFRNLISIILLSFFCSSSLFASPWKFEIAPYLWAINMNGRVGIGPSIIHVDENFSDILKQLNFAAMIYATAHKDQFGLYFNGIYSVLSNSQNIDTISINGKNNFGVFGGGISYIVLNRQLANNHQISLEPYAGLRYTLNNTRITIGPFTVKKNVNWTDPVIGLRLNYVFNRNWSTDLSGDIGGTNASSHYSYSAAALLGYQPTSWHTAKLYLGYRLLDQFYKTGRGLNFYEWDMKLSGPILGASFTF